VSDEVEEGAPSDPGSSAGGRFTLASPKGPLFGRTTADLLLEEIGLREMALFLPDYSSEQLVETFR
jgi:hypothetical protein